MDLKKNISMNNPELQYTAFENAMIGMLIFSSENKVLQCNKEAKTLFSGIGALKGKSFNDLFIIDSPFEFKKLFHINTPGPHWENIIRLRKENKEITWVNVRLDQIKNTDPNNPLILCQIQKFTSSDKLSDSFGYCDHLLVELINNIPDNIFIKDKESRFILANIHVAKIMGVNSPDNLLGKTDFDFYPKKLAQKYRKDELEILVEGKAKLNIIEQVVDKNHNRRWYSTSKLPLKNNNGEIMGIMGMGRDITQLVKEQKALRKAKHEAEKADKLKSAFLANMSHEIRTPLNGILGFSQFLLQYIPPDEKAEKYVDLILRNGTRLLQLISDIIDASKIQANQLEITNRLFSLNEVIIQLEHSARENLKLYEKSHITLNTELALPNDESYIINDDQRIKQVLHNLLSNAIKFTENGSIRFGYRLIKKQLYFFVEDTGIGINEKDFENIFNLFTQVDSSLGRRYEGTGLGLSIARGLVLLLGGKMGVNSELGKGSEFFFTLPYDNTSNKEFFTNK